MWSVEARHARFAALGLVLCCTQGIASSLARMDDVSAAALALPPPQLEGKVALERAIQARRSVREYRDAPLALADIGQILWAAQGITHAGLRTAPSAGALYPLEVYVVARHVTGLAAGFYKYVPGGHRLRQVSDVYRGGDLAAAALGQDCVRDGAAVLVFAAVERRTTRKYGARGVRYVHMEVGHAAQNAFLQATALGIGAVTVGAFGDEEVHRLLQLPAQEAPLYLMPLGVPP